MKKLDEECFLEDKRPPKPISLDEINIQQELNTLLPINSNEALVFCSIIKEKLSSKKVWPFIHQDTRREISQIVDNGNAQEAVKLYIQCIAQACTETIKEMMKSQKVDVGDDFRRDCPKAAILKVIKLANAVWRMPYKMAIDHLPYNNPVSTSAKKARSQRKLAYQTAKSNKASK